MWHFPAFPAIHVSSRDVSANTASLSTGKVEIFALFLKRTLQDLLVFAF